MNPEEAYKTFTNYLTTKEPLEIKTGKGGLSYYKNGVFVCHFNAKPQSKRDDIGFADFRYDAIRPYLDVEKALKGIEEDAIPEVQIKHHKLWSTLHFPLTLMEHVADLFSKHIISKISPIQGS